ncbi:ABC transporter permease [Desnuesiella massiliensis]|uniref:ABC transporter permease n=1 Tax=Desnuesiella massiliensis TaxID=1650662 RepID=UPI001FA6D2CB|nr:ABC transporter permease [Desnuesiella massiliensis]
MELKEELFALDYENHSNADEIVRPSMSFWQDAWRRLKKNKMAMVSLVILCLIMLACLIIPIVTGNAFQAQNTTLAHQKPNMQSWFGRDELGRDNFLRIWAGGRVSILIGLVGTAISLTFGVLYGGISGYFGGIVDDIMMRIVEIIVGIPYMIVVILMSVVLGKGLVPLMIALCLTSWTGLARLVRGQILQLKESEYIIAAKTLGTSHWRIITKHLIPNTLSVIIVNTTFQIPGFIFAEAFLSFIGLGIQPPDTSWGAMAAVGQVNMSYYPHELLFPALAISVTMLAFNLLGDGLRDAFDPKLRQ